ncbi:asparaginase [Streptomyces bluensis]|uniref:asparaginase n=1 Tax=Streptomyces bluensis TaxID=33897 RepID=UPI00199D5A61|nr:asparaginase [Streptomyces bluensis]GGZ68786.1 L-asparaginase [Streptomyces bluensis]
MRRVVVLSTGGTIASRPDSRGAARATDGAEALLAGLPGLPGPADVAVEGRDVARVGSYLLTPGGMAGIVREVHRALDDPDVAGVVVTHGTDTLEETAFLADLVHRDPRSVVFTGAQRHAANRDTDGPRNLADAVAVAASPQMAGCGVLIVFDGRIFAARGARKSHTLAPAAFSAPDSGPLGRVTQGVPRLSARPVRPPALGPSALDLEAARVDIVACYPGSDAIAMDAFAAAGARGLVLEATGAGNANHDVYAAIARLTRAGIVVALSSRVHAGPVAALYGNGGGADLVRAGAVPTGTLRASQARILLAALLATDTDPIRAASELSRHADFPDAGFRQGDVPLTDSPRPSDSPGSASPRAESPRTESLRSDSPHSESPRTDPCGPDAAAPRSPGAGFPGRATVPVRSTERNE